MRRTLTALGKLLGAANRRLPAAERLRGPSRQTDRYLPIRHRDLAVPHYEVAEIGGRHDMRAPADVTSPNLFAE